MNCAASTAGRNVAELAKVQIDLWKQSEFLRIQLQVSFALNEHMDRIVGCVQHTTKNVFQRLKKSWTHFAVPWWRLWF
jgi:hypothetical protein